MYDFLTKEPKVIHCKNFNMYTSELFRELIMNELRKFEGSNESPSAVVFVNIYIKIFHKFIKVNNSVITKLSRK